MDAEMRLDDVTKLLCCGEVATWEKTLEQWFNKFHSRTTDGWVKTKVRFLQQDLFEENGVSTLSIRFGLNVTLEDGEIEDNIS